MNNVIKIGSQDKLKNDKTAKEMKPKSDKMKKKVKTVKTIKTSHKSRKLEDFWGDFSTKRKTVEVSKEGLEDDNVPEVVNETVHEIFHLDVNPEKNPYTSLLLIYTPRPAVIMDDIVTVVLEARVKDITDSVDEKEKYEEEMRSNPLYSTKLTLKEGHSDRCCHLTDITNK